ncbi:MAG: 5-(carboxyamino)imidazole ribonucleotide mutase [Deltaproteobacteria bacterium]|nr:MAG: 5-(carboxyamino)imidazole ribonucleotide mutase [Deltaproteobacteria bacterium]
MTEERPLVGVVMGSTSDSPVMEASADVLKELEIPYEIRVISAHRTPDLCRDYALSAKERGIEVIIAGAGWAAHLAGSMAAHTMVPVIGVPIDSSPLGGMDALLSTVQMPPGIPVATMAVGKGGARNAAVFAAEILGLKYPAVAERLERFRAEIRRKATEKVEPLG